MCENGPAFSSIAIIQVAGSGKLYAQVGKMPLSSADLFAHKLDIGNSETDSGKGDQSDKLRPNDQ